jgi:hypothetical protein
MILLPDIKGLYRDDLMKMAEGEISIMSFQIMRFDTCVISLFLVFIHN